MSARELKMSFIIDNIAIPDHSMLASSDYYCNYVRHGGKRKYQEYIQLVERHFDCGEKTALEEFIKENFEHFVSMCRFSGLWVDK